ncbi:DUF1772 domain-containing protein [Phormidium tenue FACHB-886]|nr:DUF1772 domain-containing protein [Phormidium tenue FACHB-886]
MTGNKGRAAISKALLWLFVINLGIAFGAGLYEVRIVLPQWLVYSTESGYEWNAEAARQANTGLRFWVYVTTVPLTLLTLANFIAAWRNRGVLRRWWLAAAGIATIERVFTLFYFVPTMIKLMNETQPASAAVNTALQWVNLNHFRHVIALTAWLAALKAFSLFSERMSGQTSVQ